MQAIQTNCPWLLRYLVTAIILTKVIDGVHMTGTIAAFPSFPYIFCCIPGATLSYTEYHALYHGFPA